MIKVLKYKFFPMLRHSYNLDLLIIVYNGVHTIGQFNKGVLLQVLAANQTKQGIVVAAEKVDYLNFD